MCGRYVSTSPPDEIAKYFGGAEKLREAIHELQTILYAA